jgi:4-carboxymuconolactone decarboxylase
MAELTGKERELVALGASLGSNCLPCIAYHIREAQKCGLGADQIKEALEVADKVRQVPADLVRNTAYAQLDASPPEEEPGGERADGGCGCGDAAEC